MNDKTVRSAKCPKCGDEKNSFYSKKIDTIDDVEELIAICCGHCGAIISFLPLEEIRKYYENISDRLTTIEEKLGL